MEQKSIFEKVMNRSDADERDYIALARYAGEQEAAAESGNEEIEPVKTHNRLLLMSAAGAVALGVLATVVLAQQNVISLSGISAVQKNTPAVAATTKTAAAQADTKKKDAATSGTAAAPARASTTDQQKTIFNEHVERAGVTACKDVFPALGFAAAAGSTFNATTSWSDKDASQHSISSVVGMNFNTATLKGSGASFVFSVPTAAQGGCEGTFVRVVPVTQDCNAFASTLPKDSEVGPSLQGIPVITLPNGLQTLLMPSAGNGCVVVTTSRAAANDR